MTKRKERHAQILALLSGLKQDPKVTVLWLARQMRMGGERSLISKDVRELQREGKIECEKVRDSLMEAVGSFPRTRSQRILVVWAKGAINERAPRRRGSR